MPTYVYETLGDPPRQFELWQGMNEKPLKKHLTTGEPVRRVISGGLGLIVKGDSPAFDCGAPGGCCGGGACGV